MKNEELSKRHNLFFIKEEREGCSGKKLSTLYQESNPIFLNEQGDMDMMVIEYLIEKVFKKYFDEVKIIIKIHN